MGRLSEVLADYVDVDGDAAVELANIADLCRQTGRKGSVVLRFAVEPKGARVLVSVSSEAKPPKSDAEVHLWHVGADGLSKDDPHQVRLDTTTHGRTGDGRLVSPDGVIGDDR